MSADLLATIFAILMAIAVLVYAILDGYDLGIGILLPLDNEPQRDRMIASIGPFWDANETWLVLAVGLLLIAFPTAHSQVFYHLYLPATFMLAGLILRGVAFDFRAKTSVTQKPLWDRAFKAGSLLTSFCQGFMLGQYIMGFEGSLVAFAFACLTGVGVSATYCLIGAAWLIYKSEGALQKQAWKWLYAFTRISFVSIVTVSITNLIVNPNVLTRWFELSWALVALVVPTLCLIGFIVLQTFYHNRPKQDAAPLLVVMGIFMATFSGLAFSFYPYIIPNQLTIWDAASAPESLQFILIGALVVIPTIALYTAYSYWVFRGKSTALSYE